MRIRLPLFITIVMVLCLAACSNDGVGPPANDVKTNLISGEIGTTDFEITIEATGDVGSPQRGPFLLQGSNLHYDGTLGALVVDLTISNHGVHTYPEPISLVFLSLLPPGVTVMNPDNDEHGAGAKIDFEFANDDGMWTPGETSFPRSVQFDVDPGVSVGFTAMLVIGQPNQGGVIGGRVWNDANENGLNEDTEFGIEGALVHLTYSTSPDSIVRGGPGFLWETRTGPTGHYSFGELRAGFYQLSVIYEARPTTPTVMQVLLTESGGVVSSFMMGDFGFVLPGDPHPIIRGDYVEVKGKYEDTTDVVLAAYTHHERCAFAMPPCVPGMDCGCFAPTGLLRGPITALLPSPSTTNSRVHYIEIMGSTVMFDSTAFDSTGTWEPQVGDMVEAVVSRIYDPVDFILGLSLHKWAGDQVEVHGRVDQVINYRVAPPVIVVLGVKIYGAQPRPPILNE